VFLPLLDVANLKLCDLGSAQAAAEKNGKDGSISPTL
jgi:hypothetical protein